MSLNVLIMGPAGAGKGTMSELISEHYHVQHVSTGDMFREHLKNNTELGLKAKSYMEKGLLVPDDVTIEMVMEYLERDDCKNGYLLDGFPRSLVQANVFDAKVIDSPMEINLVINLEVDEESLISRIENRRVCRQCGATYNLITIPTKTEGVCDECGGELYQRSDDNRESLAQRLHSYKEETAPVLEHYRRLNLVKDINASQTIEEVWQELAAVIDAHLARQKEDM